MGLVSRRLIIFTVAALILFAFVAISISVFDTGMATAQKAVQGEYGKSVFQSDRHNPGKGDVRPG